MRRLTVEINRIEMHQRMYATGGAPPCAKFEYGQCSAAVMALPFQLSDIPKE